jgi:hypothetical protein
LQEKKRIDRKYRNKFKYIQNYMVNMAIQVSEEKMHNSTSGIGPIQFNPYLTPYSHVN